jgi:predicted membrane metal-binding protein
MPLSMYLSISLSFSLSLSLSLYLSLSPSLSLSLSPSLSLLPVYCIASGRSMTHHVCPDRYVKLRKGLMPEDLAEQFPN